MSSRFDYGLADLGSRFLGGIQQSQDNKRRNALLDLEKQQYGLNEQRVGLEQKRYDQSVEEMKRAQEREAIGRRALMKDPSLLQEWGIEFDPNDPEDMAAAEGIFSQIAKEYGGFEPPQAPSGSLYQVVGPDGRPTYAYAQDAAGQTPYVKPEAPAKPGFGQAQPGVNPQTGKPDMFVLDDYGNQKWLGTAPIPPASSQPKPLSPKDAATAKTKITLIRQAKQQLALVKKRIQEAKGYASGGYFGVQGYIPSEEGKLLDGAVDSMRNIITSLTRTPGIGANSDFETRLQQAQLPVRTDREAVQDQKAQSMQDLLDALEAGYMDILGEETGQSSGPTPIQSGPRRIKYNAQGQREQ